jgi:hypothetical protein
MCDIVTCTIRRALCFDARDGYMINDFGACMLVSIDFQLKRSFQKAQRANFQLKSTLSTRVNLAIRGRD